jgi:ABC-type amino acid transport substrate-binding protein
LIFNYLSVPAFLNKTTVGAYAAKDNEIGEVNSLNELRKHTLSITRGNSFGEKIDSFVQSLDSGYIFEVSSFAQAVKLVGIKRADYFFRVDSNYKSTIRDHHKKYPNYSHLEFKKIYEIQRETPVYFAFGKNTGNYEKYADKWLNALKLYHANVMIDERIRHHKQISGN